MKRAMAIVAVLALLMSLNVFLVPAGTQQVGYYVGQWIHEHTGSPALGAGAGATAGWGARTLVSAGAQRLGAYIATRAATHVGSRIGAAIGTAVGGPVGTAVGFFVGGM